MARKPLRSDLAWSTVDRIVVRGKDLPGEILGHLNLGDMAFLELTGRVPSTGEIGGTGITSPASKRSTSHVSPPTRRPSLDSARTPACALCNRSESAS